MRHSGLLSRCVRGVRARSCAFRAAVRASTLALLVAAGCTTTLLDRRATTTAPADAALLAPIERPAGFDAEKAGMALAQIPGDPPAPVRAEARQGGLPAPALRYMEEARRLFGEQRYTETILEIEKVLRYSANSHEAYRLMALACLLSGNDARARMAADRVVALNAADLAAHYVLGRFAEKAGKTDDAITRYRMALKCPVEGDDLAYATLTNYYLGLLLDSKGYYTAAIEQLTAFEAGLARLGSKAQEHPELSTIARVHRGTTAIRLANAHALLGNYAAAADALRVASEQSPRDLEVRGAHVRMLARAKRFDDAATEATRLVEAGKADKTTIELLLAVHRAAGQPEKGIEALREIASGQPQNTALGLMYVDTLLSAGRDRDAVQSLTELIARNPSETAGRWKLIEIHRRQREWDRWLGALADMVAAHPLAMSQAASELSQVPADASARLLKAQLQRPTDSAPAEPADARVPAARDYLAGRLAARLDRPDDAARLYERAVKTSPGFVPATVAIAESYLRACRWQDAITLLEAAMKDSETTVAHYERLMAQAYEGLDDAEQATAHYEKAIQADRNDAEPMLLLGQLHQRIGQADDAQKQFRAAIAARPEWMRPREELIHSLLSGGGSQQRLADPQARLTRVLAELNEMQRAAPESIATLRSAALLKLIQTTDRDAYLQTIRELVQRDPGDMESRIYLVKGLLEFKDYAAARTEAAEMLARDPRLGIAGEVLSVAMTRMLEFDEAAEQIERMIECHPKRESWLRQLSDLRLLQQDYDAAVALNRRLLETGGAEASPDRALLYHLRLSQVLREAGRAEELKRLADAWLEEHGKSERHRRFYRALALTGDAGTRDYQRYLERCRTWLKAEPESAEARRWLLVGLIQADREDEAAAYALEWLSQVKPDAQAQALAVLADVLGSGKQPDGSVEIVRNLLAAAKTPEERLNRLLLLHATCTKARRYDQAVSALKELIAQAESVLDRGPMAELQKSLAPVLAQAGRYDEAVTLLNGLIRQLDEDNDDDRVKLLQILSLVHMRQGRKDLAEQRLREAYALGPEDVHINNDLGYTLADAGKDLEEAARMIRYALGEQPRQIAYMDSYGWVLYKAGDFKEARTWLQRASRVVFSGTDQYMERILTNPATPFDDEQDAVIYDHLGDAEWRLGEKQAAVASWKRAREIHDRQVREGDDSIDKELPERVDSKLKAVDEGDEPPVAPLAPASQPAA